MPSNRARPESPRLHRIHSLGRELVGAWWPRTAGTLSDVANEIVGVYIGTPTVGFSPWGSCLHLNGSTQYVILTRSILLRQAGPYSIAARFRCLSAANYPFLFSHWYEGDGSYHGIAFNFMASGQLRLIHGDGTLSATSCLTNTTFTDPTRWYNVVGTWDGANYRLYVDGQIDAVAAKSTPPSWTGNEPARIGDLYLAGTEQAFLYGDIDYMAFWARALSDDDVATLEVDPYSPFGRGRPLISISVDAPAVPTENLTGTGGTTAGAIAAGYPVPQLTSTVGVTAGATVVIFLMPRLAGTGTTTAGATAALTSAPRLAGTGAVAAGASGTIFPVPRLVGIGDTVAGATAATLPSIVYPLLTVVDDNGAIVSGATVQVADLRNVDDTSLSTGLATIRRSGANVAVEYNPEANGEAWITLAISGGSFSGLNQSPSFYLAKDPLRLLTALPYVVPGANGGLPTVNASNQVTLPSIPSNWITAAGITANSLNGKGDWSADDPWSTALLASYGTGTAGKLLGSMAATAIDHSIHVLVNMPANVSHYRVEYMTGSSRQWWNGSAMVTTEPNATAIPSGSLRWNNMLAFDVAGLPVGEYAVSFYNAASGSGTLVGSPIAATIGGTAISLDSAQLTAIASAVLAASFEGPLTISSFFRLAVAVLVGNSTNGGLHYNSPVDDSTTRIVEFIDGSMNRTTSWYAD